MANVLMVVGVLLLLEGLGPLLMPSQWQKMMADLSKQDPALVRRVGGALVTVGGVILYIFS